ncbi:MAG: endonuclease III [Actinobacteria bacterium]|nr:endonuclease III [Actinomycetota bacterium]
MKAHVIKNGLYKPAVENVAIILKLLGERYRDSVTTSLNHSGPFQLLIATILSAQSTDKQINKVTPGLFKKYPDPLAFAGAVPGELEQDIKSTGFYRNKAKSLILCCRDLMENFGGKVPDNIEDLTTLHGVGRKTANVVLANSFGRQAIIVDTHMKRIAYRLGLTNNTDPDKIEYDLMKIIPQNNWTDFSHKVIAHGRTICLGRNPGCSICPVIQFCRYGQENA